MATNGGVPGLAIGFGIVALDFDGTPELLVFDLDTQASPDAAYNAAVMCGDLPRAAFLAFDARHCAGAEMAEMMAYAASVGSVKARRERGAKGFIGNATDATKPATVGLVEILSAALRQPAEAAE